MNYKIIDENNITYDFKIEQIIDLIKKNLNKKFYKFIDNTKIEINNKIVSET